VRRGGGGLVVAVQNVTPHRDYAEELHEVWKRWKELGIVDEENNPKQKAVNI